MWLSRFACLTFVLICLLSSLAVWAEDCGDGYYPVATKLGENATDLFAFANANICGICGVDYCRDCSESQGPVCEACVPGFFLAANNTCSECTKEGCLECRHNERCTKCAEGYALRDGAWLPDGTRVQHCVACPTDDGCL